jgi:peroxiredoxin Q/BCP
MGRAAEHRVNAFAASIALLSMLVAAPALAAELAVGDPAPTFTLPGTDGEIHSLADSLGSRAVVLAWFPKAFTPG